jgi:hypothetical protein
MDSSSSSERSYRPRTALAIAGIARGIAHVDNRITVQSFHDSKMDEWDDIC